MNKTLTCILCPNSCETEISFTEQNGEAQILSIQGNRCKKGEDYARQELISPVRTISSSVRIIGGELPLLSVRLSSPVPRSAVPAVMAKIRAFSLSAPVKSGTVLIQNILGLGADLIATKSIEAVEA